MLTRLAVAATGLFLVVPSSAPAAGSWGRVTSLDRGSSLASPSVAVGADGRAVAAWHGRSSSGWFVRAARAGRASGFRRAVDLQRQAGELGAPLAAIDAEGDALVAYRRFVVDNDRLETRVITPDGARLAPVLLSGTGSSAYAPAWLATPAESLVEHPVLAWWLRESLPDGEIDQLKLAEARDGVFSPAPSNGAPGDPAGALGRLPDGTVAMIDSRFNSAHTSTRPQGGDFTERRYIPGAIGDIGTVDLAVSADGTTAAAWTEYSVPTRVRVSIRPPGGEFGPAVTVGEEVNPLEGRQALAVAITSLGKVRVAWRVDEGGGHGPVRVATLGSGRPGTATLRGEQAELVQLEADGRGHCTLLWQNTRGAVIARTVARTGEIGRRSVLTPRRERGREPSLAVGPDGKAVAAWATASGRAIHAVRYRPRP